MNIFEIIQSVGDIISVEDIIISVAGLIFLFIWLVKASLGMNTLADFTPRLNYMPFYLPFIPLFIWIVPVPLTILILRNLLANFPDWQVVFFEHIIFCVGAIVIIITIILLVRDSFAQRVKGFGLNVKTIHKDFFVAFLNLLSVWPLMLVAIILTTLFGKIIWGPDFFLEKHEELKTITEYSQLPLRVMIIITAVVVVPLFEEMLFRGMFQTVIRTYFENQKSKSKVRYGAWLAILISSGLFAIIHANPGHWPILFVLALCLGYSYEKSGSLFRPIFIHSIFNTIPIITVLYQ